MLRIIEEIEIEIEIRLVLAFFKSKQQKTLVSPLVHFINPSLILFFLHLINTIHQLL